MNMTGPPALPNADTIRRQSEIPENIYGHRSRLDWIASGIPTCSTVLEFGCGTGYMITLQLLRRGIDATGIDVDEASIEYGRQVFFLDGRDQRRLLLADISELDTVFDVVVASEVLEHIPDPQLDRILDQLVCHTRLGGTVLITVPNGYGWFEFEDFLWNRLRLRKLCDWLKLPWATTAIKRRLVNEDYGYAAKSTLSASPHVQRFTVRSIRRLLQRHDLQIQTVEGTVMFAGELSDLLFTGYGLIQTVNARLGRALTPLASGFMIRCIRGSSDPDASTVSARTARRTQR